MEGILSQPLSSYSAREQRLGVKHNQTMTFAANEDSNSQRYLNIETQMNSIKSADGNYGVTCKLFIKRNVLDCFQLIKK